MKKIVFLFFGCWILFFLSCEQRATTCISSSPDIAFFAEQFNTAQSKHKILFHYSENCREYLIQEQIPDIVFDWDIQDTVQRINYKTLRSVLGKRGNYYSDLLNQGKIRGRQKMIPISFNLPAVIYKHTPGEAEYQAVVNFKQMDAIARDWNRQNQYEYLKLGFSPLWDQDALYLAYRMFDLQFINKEGGFTVNQTALEQAEEQINRWTGSLIPDINKEQFFRDKYRKTPGYRLIQEEKVLFFYYQTDDLFLIPQPFRSNQLFAWLNNGSKIPSDESFLFAAIPEKTKNAKGAQAFLSWLLNPEIQKMLIQKKNKEGYTSFGFCEGFSSIKEINEKVLTQFYPELKSRMPRESEILFPEFIPLGFYQAKEEVITDWLVQKLLGKNEMDLAFELDKWSKQQFFFH